MKKLKCVKCGSFTNHGGWISVNVYDPVVGRNMGVECGGDNCIVKKGSPADHKFYWYRHFLAVILQPDWFADYTYEDFWQKIENYVKDPKIVERLPQLRKMIEKTWGKNKKHWWQFWR